jgi:hypothetical protein
MIAPFAFFRPQLLQVPAAILHGEPAFVIACD